MENIKINYLPAKVKASTNISTSANQYCIRIWSNDKWYLYYTPMRSFELFYRNIFKDVKDYDKKSHKMIVDQSVKNEAYPKDEDFGDFAWAFNNLNSVFRFLNIERPNNIVLPF